MKIVIVSDSHGDNVLLEKIHLIHQDAQFFYHLGDSELPEYMLFYYASVKGNCDFATYPLVRDIIINDFKIHMEHGNNFNFQMNPNKYIKNLNVEIFLFGHTHKKLATKISNTYVFNPGSLTRPRDSDKGSYLVLELKDNKTLEYKFYEVDLN